MGSHPIIIITIETCRHRLFAPMHMHLMCGFVVGINKYLVAERQQIAPARTYVINYPNFHCCLVTNYESDIWLAISAAAPAMAMATFALHFAQRSISSYIQSTIFPNYIWRWEIETNRVSTRNSAERGMIHIHAHAQYRGAKAEKMDRAYFTWAFSLTLSAISISIVSSIMRSGPNIQIECAYYTMEALAIIK